MSYILPMDHIMPNSQAVAASDLAICFICLLKIMLSACLHVFLSVKQKNSHLHDREINK